MLVFYTSVNCQLGPWKFSFRKRFLFSISNLFKVNKTNKQQTKGKRDEFVQMSVQTVKLSMFKGVK